MSSDPWESFLFCHCHKLFYARYVHIRNRNFCIESYVYCLKPVRNILFEVLAAVFYTFFPHVWQFVEFTPKKLLVFWGKAPIELLRHVFAKSEALLSECVSATMQTSCNREDSSLHLPFECFPHTANWFCLRMNGYLFWYFTPFSNWKRFKTINYCW